jgi:predicted dehydrogenase
MAPRPPRPLDTGDGLPDSAGGMPGGARIRVGVVGCGLIAQVMHLPYLAELDDRYELVAVCDLSPALAEWCATRYGAGQAVTDADTLLGLGLDLVMVLTGGSHADLAVAAADAGCHVFVEKPLALSEADGQRMTAAAERAGRILAVGNMKRYDPAYERLAELVPEVADLRLVRSTTLESPLAPYVAHYPFGPREQLPRETLDRLEADADRHAAAALGDVDAETRWCYRFILLDNLVHELNVLRGVLGDPLRVVSAQVSRRVASINLDFAAAPCHLSWVDLPGIAGYRQEFAFYGPDRRVTFRLPSPFLRSAPSEIEIEDGDVGTARSSRTIEILGYEEAFKRELVDLADCIRDGRSPRTTGADATRDLAVCAAIVRAHVTGAPVEIPPP